ncbi:MAG: class I SAM-dependent methyltransferase [Bacteroidetes bacterium]|nr:class I SAM-dependent methyltransferase [Bacteroidota bacterium]MBS1776232.1 class I SAM-dependent methyltransferase [Bacteroidota bacterium]
MKKTSLSKLRCPKTKSKLAIKSIAIEIGDEIVEGVIENEKGFEYIIKDGIVDFITEEDLKGDAGFARNYYKGIAHTYDQNVDITFSLYFEDELKVRNYMIDLLGLKPNYKILEISAGTGKDSEIILKRLKSDGELFCLDISPDMLKFNKQKLDKFSKNSEVVCGTACDLPFDDNTFDALYCFAGVGHFPSIKKGLSEMARVVKKGGKVVFCEKNVPEWLRETTYGKILINNNSMFAYDAPLKYIPVEARNVGIRWIIGNVHYVVDYEVGDGEPKGNFDIPLPGERGGTFNTRYFGKLEGVSDETKKLAKDAQSKLGISMYEWLDNLIKHEAIKILNG